VHDELYLAHLVNLGNDDALGLILKELLQLSLLTLNQASINHTHSQVSLHQVLMNDKDSNQLRNPEHLFVDV
jgi:hypothetical protein